MGDGPGVGPVAWLVGVVEAVVEFLGPDGVGMVDVCEGAFEHFDAVLVWGGVLVFEGGTRGGDIDEVAGVGIEVEVLLKGLGGEDRELGVRGVWGVE